MKLLCQRVLNAYYLYSRMETRTHMQLTAVKVFCNMQKSLANPISLSIIKSKSCWKFMNLMLRKEFNSGPRKTKEQKSILFNLYSFF